MNLTVQIIVTIYLQMNLLLLFFLWFNVIKALSNAMEFRAFASHATERGSIVYTHAERDSVYGDVQRKRVHVHGEGVLAEAVHVLVQGES